MGLESATYINGLVATNPTTTDNANQGDNHLRLVKSVLKNTFPNLTGAVTVSHTDINSVTSRLPLTGGTLTGSLTGTSGTFSGTVTAAGFIGPLTGTVTGGTASVAESGTNLYFTTARARAAISASGDIAYNPATGVISFTAAGAPVTSVAGKTGAVTLAIADIDSLQSSLNGKAPLNGTGTSGTWPISISGNAATANSATSATAASYATNSGTAVNVSGVVAVANGGTGANNAASARANLGVPSLSQAVPVGAVFHFAASTAPSGFLVCDGSAVSRTTYSALFAIVGVTYGSGNGVDTFNLPDLRGEFIRGWDGGRGVDSGRSFGSFQEDQFESHTHSISHYAESNNIGSNIAGGNGASTVTWNTNATGGTETRPRNVALLPCIKF